MPGEGPEDAALMFVGEAPGYNEDQQGRPFVGAAGHFLDELLASIGFRRDQVFITNIVKCRPPGNRDPFPAEISACSKYLDRQIELVNPKLIVTLGRHSLARLLPGSIIGKLRGKPQKYGSLTIYPVYHPAAGLYKQSLRRAIEDDFRAIPEILIGFGNAKPDVPNQQQLSMF